MKNNDMGFTLSFEGNNADEQEIDFYDVAHALVGFQRSLAITTHLILNNQVITRATALEGAKIIAQPPEDGSWKIWATIAYVTYQLGAAPQNSLIGHLVYSAYDYVVSETLGFHVDYNKSLGQLYEEHQREVAEQNLHVIGKSRLDSVVEKCEVAIRDMHRPIVKSETAQLARIIPHGQEDGKYFNFDLNEDTYDYINFTQMGNEPEEIEGYISSYNSNTYKGRMYVADAGRPIPFMLSDVARQVGIISHITRSLHLNAQERMQKGSVVKFKGYKNFSRTGRLRNLLIIGLSEEES